MYDKDDLMHKGIWYGEIPTQSKEKLWYEINNEKDEKKKLLLVIDLLKLGDFSAKSLLFKIMNESNNDSVKNLCLRVFCSVVNHYDLQDNNNLAVLADADDDAVNTFAVCSIEALSYEVVPYLLALLEDWEGTYEENTIRDALQDILNYQEVLLEEASVDEIGNFYLNQKDKENNQLYYYNGQETFPGYLTKQLLDLTAQSRSRGSALKEITIPTLLSIWSGIKCPVQYDTIVDDEIIQSVYSYIKQLSLMKWEKGCKYFYGHKIV